MVVFFFLFYYEKELGAIAANRLRIEYFCILTVSSVFPFTKHTSIFLQR